MCCVLSCVVLVTYSVCHLKVLHPVSTRAAPSRQFCVLRVPQMLCPPLKFKTCCRFMMNSRLDWTLVVSESDKTFSFTDVAIFDIALVFVAMVTRKEYGLNSCCTFIQTHYSKSDCKLLCERDILRLTPERVAKRGRKLVDYDSARHHLEALQNSKKRDEAKISKADEEFNKAQEVFEDINKELREELPVLYQSRISCYVTMFQNISNLRDVFYKEMSMLNHNIYNMMKKLEDQHSTKPFIVKGLNSSKSKKRKSVTISAPIPCNTAFPPDHPAMSKLSMPSTLADARSDTPSKSMGSTASEISDSESNSFDSEPNTPKRQSLCSEGEGVRSEEATENTSETTSDEPMQANGQEHQDSASAEHGEEEETKSAASSEETHNASTDGDNEAKPTSDAQDKTTPVPVPRRSSVSKKNEEEANQNTSGCSKDVKVQNTEYENPPGFLYKAVALQSQDSDEGMLLQFEKGDVILAYIDEEEETPEGNVWAVREQDWIQYKDLTLLSGIVEEAMIQRITSD